MLVPFAWNEVSRLAFVCFPG